MSVPVNACGLEDNSCSEESCVTEEYGIARAPVRSCPKCGGSSELTYAEVVYSVEACPKGGYHFWYDYGLYHICTSCGQNLGEYRLDGIGVYCTDPNCPYI